MANETDRECPAGGQQREEGETAKKRPYPLGEQETQGSEQEYQGNEPAGKRAPGIEEDGNTEGEGNRKSA